MCARVIAPARVARAAARLLNSARHRFRICIRGASPRVEPESCARLLERDLGRSRRPFARMGQTLSEPVVDKHSDQGQDSRYAYGVSEMQGWRLSEWARRKSASRFDHDGARLPVDVWRILRLTQPFCSLLHDG